MRVGDPIQEAEKRVGVPATALDARATMLAAWGERVRRQRNAIGISQKELAQVAGVSHGYLSELEQGTAATLDLLGPINQALRERLFRRLREIVDAIEGAA